MKTAPGLQGSLDRDADQIMFERFHLATNFKGQRVGIAEGFSMDAQEGLGRRCAIMSWDDKVGNLGNYVKVN